MSITPISVTAAANVASTACEQIVNPIRLNEARPTISFNTIQLSADAAISADPNSFREMNFHSPTFQLNGAFTSDYSRVGPDIDGNTIVHNSTNGLKIRVLTGNSPQAADGDRAVG